MCRHGYSLSQEKSEKMFWIVTWPISHRFRDKRRFPSKIASFSHLRVYIAPAGIVYRPRALQSFNPALVVIMYSSFFLHTNGFQDISEYSETVWLNAPPLKKIRAPHSGSGHFPYITVRRYCAVQHHETTPKHNSKSVNKYNRL